MMHVNITELMGTDDVPVNRTLRLFLVLTTGFLCVLLNSLNIAVLRKAPNCFGETTTLLFTALAIVDLFTGVVILFSEPLYVLTDVPVNSTLFCSFVYPVIVVCGILSAMLLGCLSFDKLIAIMRPLRYTLIVTKFRVAVVVFIVFVIGAMNMFGLYVLLLANSENPDVMYFHNESLYCRMHMESDAGARLYAITLLQTFGFLCMLLPLMIVTYVNLRLLAIVIHHNRKLSIKPYAGSTKFKLAKQSTIMETPPNTSPCESPIVTRKISSRVSLPLIHLKKLRLHRASTVSVVQRRSHYKGLRTVLVMILVYYIAWMPMLVDVFLNIVQSSETTPKFEFVTYILAYSNSWWNALVYLLMNHTYRRAALKIIHCHRYL